MRVFSHARIAVLKLVASQAAISFENARLYRDLAQREARIQRLKILKESNARLHEEVKRRQAAQEALEDGDVGDALPQAAAGGRLPEHHA